MNRLKRILAGTAVILLLGASACAGHSGQGVTAQPSAATQPAEETETVKKPYRVGVCIYDYKDNFMTQYREELRHYLTETWQAQVYMADSQGSQEEQNRQVRQFLEQGSDVLIINVVEAEAVASLTDLCREASVPVVFINRRPESEEIRRWEQEGIPAAYVGTDARQSGAYQGEIVLSLPNQGDFNGDGSVGYVMITGPEDNQDARYRTEYSVKALEEAGVSVKKLMERCGNWREEEGYQLVSNALFRFGREIEVIFCNNDAMANGARKAVLEMGRSVGKDICLVGVDALRETIGYVKEGTVTGTVFNDYVTQSHTASDVAVKLAGGEKADGEYLVDYVKIVGDLYAYSVGLCFPETKEESELLFREELEQRLKKDYNARVEIVEENGDWNSLVKEINDFSRNHMDVIILDLSRVTEPDRVRKKCGDAGLPALFINEKVKEAKSDAQALESGEASESEERKEPEETQDPEEIQEPEETLSASEIAERAIGLAEEAAGQGAGDRRK